MGLLSELKKGSKVEIGKTNLTTDTILEVDEVAITPTNAGEFGIYRTTPVLDKPRSFSQKEANAITQLAAKRKIEAQATKKAVNALMQVKNADVTEHKAYNQYRGHEAAKTYQQVKDNAQTGNRIAGLASKYNSLHQSVEHRLQMEEAKNQAISGNLKETEYSKLW